uniref:Apoptotic chromatin condensation inducer 1b n=2 Tax=Nothobranchius korthausae TaxID=1143690 RepID=A0A1A8FUH0_9TELE
MADEDITLDGKPLQSLRVADLKAALEQRNLPKSGQKNTLIKRLKGALMLENLQKSSSSHSVLQPNSQIGEEMCQNSFIKQYLAKQQELLRHRLEREAQRGEEADESPAGPEEDEDHSEDEDSSSYVTDKSQTLPSQPSGAPGSTFHHQESPEASGVKLQRGHKEAPAPSPPRAVAYLSVRVLGQPDGPPAASRSQEKEQTVDPGSAHSALNLSRSVGRAAGNHVQEDSDDDDEDNSDDSDEDEDWGSSSGRAGMRKRAPPPLPHTAPSNSSAAARSKRKLQPPQHIPPPPQVDPTPMQLRHPTPPPSPPHNLFPLPDTPKQSPPDDQERDGLRDPQVMPFQSSTRQRKDSDSSSRSSSPEPPVRGRPGPLSLLVHKMETEEASAAPGSSGESAHSPAGCSREPLLRGSETKRAQKSREDRKHLMEEKERELQQEQEREKKRPEEEKKKTQLEEERKRRQEEEKEKKRKEEEKRREEERLKKEKTQEKAKEERTLAAETQDSGSSSDSDSKSDSSSSPRSSSSSSPSYRNKTQTVSQPKTSVQRPEADDGKETGVGKVSEKPSLSKREVSEPSTAAVTEVEPDSESSMAQQPASGSEPESSESRPEESTTPKAFAARRISLTSSKASAATTDGAAADAEVGNAGGRKRRWGSSTAVTVKKPSISITTESLKSLIPDIKVKQEMVVDLHPEELQLSGDEESVDTSLSDPDKGLKIRRTVTQVVPNDSQENGQASEDVEKMEKEDEEEQKPSRDKRKNSLSDETSETQMSVELEEEKKKVTPSDSLVRRSISQQKSGVSITIDDPVRSTRQPSPPRGKVSNIIHVTNLVRPFTLLQLKELLNRTGSVVEEGFWIDKIKSHCYVTYASTEEAVSTRTALHGVKWPASNPKVLSVDFCKQAELDFHKGILKPKVEEDPVVQPTVPPNRPPPLMRDRDKDHNRDKERDRDKERERGVRDLLAERQREMERRERTRGEREWDRDKVREFARLGEDGRRSRSRERERRRRERAKSKEKKTEKKEKDEPPVKLLDDLFLKTKAAPCIYWLPLTEEQATQKVLDRLERQKERERMRKEREEEEEKKREEEKKERLKAREKDSSMAASSRAAGRTADGERERDRGRERDGDKKKDAGHRSGRPSAGAGANSAQRSRSRSNPRDRRR